MGKWKYSYNINELIRTAPKDCTDEDAQDIAKEIVSRLTGKPGMEDAEDILYDLEGVETMDDFDSTIQELYDYADRAGIWLGF